LLRGIDDNKDDKEMSGQERREKERRRGREEETDVKVGFELRRDPSPSPLTSSIPPKNLM